MPKLPQFKVTNCMSFQRPEHKIGGLKQQKISSLISGGQSLKLRCQQGRSPSRHSRGESHLTHRLPGAPGVPWLVATSLGFLPIFTVAIPLCVFLLFLSLRRTPVSELRAHPDNPGSPHLKTHLQSRSRLDTSTCIWGAILHPTTLALGFFLIARLLSAHSPLGPMDKAQHNPVKQMSKLRSHTPRV